MSNTLDTRLKDLGRFAGPIAVVLVYAAMLAFGSDGARIGAGFGLAAFALATYGIARQLRAEDEPPMPLRASFRAALRWSGSAWLGIAAFVALVVVSTAHHPSVGLRVVAIGVAVLGVGAGFLYATSAVLRYEGIEREQHLVATSVGFFVAMVCALSVALVQSLFHVVVWPWLTWSVGLVTWGTMTTAYHRRLVG
jgi:hypothetical protein